MRIGYLGPKGTFTEQACISYNPSADRIPFVTIQEALQATEKDIVDKCVAPIENSIEGTVNATIDCLIFDKTLYIEKQIILPIEQNLMIQKGADMKEIHKIISHPQGLAQCRKFIQKNYPNALEEAVSSTAEAARLTAEGTGKTAAIASALTAEIYDLDIIYPCIQDSNNNQTSFIVATRDKRIEPQKGHITTIAFSTKNKPGELYRVLDIFSLWDINMIKIISRPMKNVPGAYIFLIDIENADVLNVADALQMVQRKTDFFKILGTYPIDDHTLKKQ